jgi:hypothetical protein
MSRKGILLTGIIAAVLVLGAVTGCGATTTGASGEVSAALDAAKEQVSSLKGELDAAQDKIAALQQQVMEAGTESGLAGSTPEETAKNIVKTYHETHTYSKTDLFVCADMAMDVWNMLQAQGIDAVIKIGDVEKAVTNMQDSGHAWVVAEIGSGKFLALETTNGRAVTQSENPLYYAGWAFENPAEYKRFEQLKYEHNLRVELIKSLNEDGKKATDDYNAAVTEYNSLLNDFNAKYAGQAASDESQAAYDQMNDQRAMMKELEGRVNELQLLVAEQQAALDSIVPKMKALAQ